MIEYIKIVAVLAAACIIGNSFLKKSRANRDLGRSKLEVYRSAPGIIIVLAILLPIFLWFVSR